MDETWIKRLPKVEIHLHLEGSVEPADLHELARRNHLPDASWPRAAFEEKYRYADFIGFLTAFKFVTEHLVRPEDYGWITSRLLERLHRQGVFYAEIFLSAGVVMKQKKDLEAIVTALLKSSRTKEEQLGIHVNWIFDVTRQFGIELAEQVIEAAARCRTNGLENVVGVGMGGDENSLPASEFKHVFASAREQGLRVTVHAGELGPAQSIREAVDVLGAERIGHGIAARLDGGLMNYLKDRRIPIECALTSNLCTGVIAKIEDHPLRTFLDGNLRVTLNTDDPALFRTDLMREYRLAATHFRFTPEDFIRLNRNALEGCFASSFQKAELLRYFEGQLSGMETGNPDTPGG